MNIKYIHHKLNIFRFIVSFMNISIILTYFVIHNIISYNMPKIPNCLL